MWALRHGTCWLKEPITGQVITHQRPQANHAAQRPDRASRISILVKTLSSEDFDVERESPRYSDI
jgi:hypothetical protein